MIRVLLVDDHPIIRQGLAALLSDEPDLEVVGQLDSAAGLPAAAASADVVVTDLEMAPPDPLTRIAGLKAVVFTAFDDRVAAALQAGARGYVLKGSPTAELVRAIRLAYEGGTYLEPRVAARLGQEVAPGLSPRQREILRLVAAGRSNKEIAAELSITERTAKFHVTGILDKLGASNRAEAVALALQRQLL